jgi:hypothetical protein
MGRLKQQMIISEELAQVAAESWEHTVMSNVREYIGVHGVSDFKDALMMFDKKTYNDLFHPQEKINDTCYLTNPK